MAYKWIYKVGLAVVSNDRLLVVRKRNTGTFILPGGKPEGLETDLATLAREVDEELGCRVESPFFRGVFKDIAAGAVHSVVVVRLYRRPCRKSLSQL
jgi:8-oxo-dGTP diphosphatase